MSRARVCLCLGGWHPFQYRLCTLVVIGARPDGKKELLAVEDGYRDSAESWKAVLRELKRRGMVAPVLAVGDGALGFWAAAREVWPETREQGCWVSQTFQRPLQVVAVLALPGQRALHEMMYAAWRSECEAAKAALRRVPSQVPQSGGIAHPELGAFSRLLRLSRRALEAFAHHQRDESAFAAVRLRERVTKGAGSRTKGLLIAY